MDKIYRRPTQSNGTAKKKKNEKNRVRNTIINFRVSPTEKKLIETRIALSGLPKAEFFIESCLYQTVLVKGNIKTFDKMKAAIEMISTEINRTGSLVELEPETMESLRMILEMFRFIYGKDFKGEE